MTRKAKIVAAVLACIALAGMSQVPRSPTGGVLRALRGAREASSQTSTAARDSSTALPWFAHFGTQDAEGPWATAVRGVGRGLSGEPDSLPALLAAVKAVSGGRDIMMPIGGLNSARDEAVTAQFLGNMRSDKGRTWEETVYRQTRAVARVVRGGQMVYWQIGNEINSRAWGSAIASNRKASGRADRNAEDLLSLYVEEYLAPSVEGLRRARADAASNEQPFKIVLGSVANASGEGSRDWLGALLNYRIEGDNAPTLRGQQVYQVIDVISYHYLVTNSMARDDWRPKLDALVQAWVATGKVQGIFATEELGRKRGERGLGGATALGLTGRYLHWWAGNGLTPSQSRMFFWGWKLGPAGVRGGDAMDTLFAFLGTSAVVDITASADAGKNVEVYAFQATADPAKRVAIVYFPWDPAGWNKKVSLAANGWATSVTVVVHSYPESGHQSVAVQLAPVNGRFTVEVPSGLSIGEKNSLLLTFQRAGP